MDGWTNGLMNRWHDGLKDGMDYRWMAGMWDGWNACSESNLLPSCITVSCGRNVCWADFAEMTRGPIIYHFRGEGWQCHKVHTTAANQIQAP